MISEAGYYGRAYERTITTTTVLNPREARVQVVTPSTTNL